ncbi:MAG: NAD-dependent epimerase/dehydratase family protein [Gammaproteobacteria bacterium]|nr:NAD-dependent epimerase/dehydratase family protein [Gammaproteobacteria bacterium]
MHILITGGAGFIGSHLARSYRRDGHQVSVLDNLHRRGSEMNLAAFAADGIAFHHGDIRCPGDLQGLPGNFDLLIEASAEPSVLAGQDGDPGYALHTNLTGAIHCLEFARHRCGGFLFLSTSRVYAQGALRDLALEETATRFELSATQVLPGASTAGISEDFPVLAARSLYGATKLAAELLIHEYVDLYGLNAVINRSSVICGPGQFGKTDQGAFSLWVAAHHYGRPLRYTGYGGTGKQVRDLLHPDDLYRLLVRQGERLGSISGHTYNIGGGANNAVSLAELTQLCRQQTGREIEITGQPDTHPNDVPLYVTDAGRAARELDWRPVLGVRDMVAGIHAWITENEASLRPLFAPE